MAVGVRQPGTADGAGGDLDQLIGAVLHASGDMKCFDGLFKKEDL